MFVPALYMLNSTAVIHYIIILILIITTATTTIIIIALLKYMCVFYIWIQTLQTTDNVPVTDCCSGWKCIAEDKILSRYITHYQHRDKLLQNDEPPMSHTTTSRRNVSQHACQLQHRPASGNGYWQATLVIACSPLDAGQTDIMINKHDRSIADFKDTERPSRPDHKLKTDATNTFKQSTLKFISYLSNAVSFQVST